MSTFHARFPGNAVTLLLTVAVVFLVQPAGATVLNPGETIDLAGQNGNPGTVIYDELVDFSIDNGDGTYLAGKLQNRVVRLDATGKLEFNYQIRDIVRGSHGQVWYIYVSDFAGLWTDVEYVTDSGGENVPRAAYRTGDGQYVGFNFDKQPLGVGDRSKFFFVDPEADCYSLNSVAFLYSTSGAAVGINIVGPGSGGAPVVDITSPDDLTCVCPDSAPIRGTVYDPGHSFAYSTLEYRAAGADAWTYADISFNEVFDGVIYNWNTTGLPAGWYTLRVTAWTNCGDSAEDTVIVYLDRTPPSIDSQAPVDRGVYGGYVCIDGFVYDYCSGGYYHEGYDIEYSTDGTNWFAIPIEWDWPARLTTWDTSALADGNYYLRISASDSCGNDSQVLRKITLDNTPPTAVITAPTSCSNVKGKVAVTGTANDAHFGGWILWYTGGDAHGWVTLAQGAKPIINGTFTTWDTTNLAPCAYTLRLWVWDSTNVNCVTSWVSEYLVSVIIGGQGDRGDINCDGSVDFDDIDGFVECLINGGCEPCP